MMTEFHKVPSLGSALTKRYPNCTDLVCKATLRPLRPKVLQGKGETSLMSQASKGLEQVYGQPKQHGKTLFPNKK